MTGLLIFIICLLIVVVLFQVTKTLDLIGELRDDSLEDEKGAHKFNAVMCLVFLVLGMIGFVWCFYAYKNKLMPAQSASEHGELISRLFFWTLLITGVVFVITNAVLFIFAYLYRYDEDRKASHIAHNNLLEVVWTGIPAVVLTFLVVLGLQAWNKITAPASEDARVFEVTGQQFFWSARYPGNDGELGEKNYNLISDQNPLGVILPEYIEHKKVRLLQDAYKMIDRQEELPGLIESTEKFIESNPNKYLVDSAKQTLKEMKLELKKLPTSLKRRQATLKRINEKFTPEYLATNKAKIEQGRDDFMPNPQVIHVEKGQEVQVRITAQDVLHNFYLPHFSVKMDAVPGIPTFFKFKPILTTQEMRDILAENPEWQRIPDGKEEARYETFEYEVACAELCGSGHNSMRYLLSVDEEDDYQEWLDTQQPMYELAKGNLLTIMDLDPDKREFPPMPWDNDGHHGGHHGDDHHGDDHHDDHGHGDAHAKAGSDDGKIAKAEN